MAVKAIAYSYWRSIKRGNRTFDNIHESVKDDVKMLAKDDVVNGIITTEEYANFIGEDYLFEAAGDMSE